LNRIIKLLPILLIPIALISLVVATGCNNDQKDNSEEFTKEELAQIITDSSQIVSEAESYKANMGMDISMEISGGDEEGTINMSMTMDGVVDQKNMEMMMAVWMNLGGDMEGIEESLMDIDMDMYLVDDYIYMKTDLFGTGEQWIKMPATDDVMSSYNMNMVEQQMAPLESLGEVTFLRYETYDGSECYVIETAPDMNAMMDWLNTQDMTGVEFDLDDLGKIGDMFQKLSYTCWIDKETKYMKKMTAEIVMEMSAEDFDEADYDMGTLIMNSTINMEMSDYNEPITITLPEEAQEAMELSA
jgi:hypothetical protein